MVVTLGSIGSHLLASSTQLPKPAIAGIVIDASWQGIPQHDGASGVRNLAYCGRVILGGNDSRGFPPAHSVSQAGRPPRSGTARGHSATQGERGHVGARDRRRCRRRSSVGDPDEILAALPAGTDAVYLTPLPAITNEGLARLLPGLNARRLPTLSYLADPDLRAGALASYEPPESWLRRARRVAVDLQRIFAGEDAGTLPVGLVSAHV